MKPAFLQYESLDDRPEILRLLERLPRRWRLRWLQWCCERIPGPMRGKVGPGFNHTALPLEIALDFWRLIFQYDLAIDPCLAKLVAVAKVAPPKSSESDMPLPTRLR